VITIADVDARRDPVEQEREKAKETPGGSDFPTKTKDIIKLDPAVRFWLTGVKELLLKNTSVEFTDQLQ